MGGTCALSTRVSSQNRPKNSDQDGFVTSSDYASISKAWALPSGLSDNVVRVVAGIFSTLWQQVQPRPRPSPA